MPRRKKYGGKIDRVRCETYWGYYGGRRVTKQCRSTDAWRRVYALRVRAASVDRRWDELKPPFSIEVTKIVGDSSRVLYKADGFKTEKAAKAALDMWTKKNFVHARQKRSQ